MNEKSKISIIATDNSIISNVHFGVVEKKRNFLPEKISFLKVVGFITQIVSVFFVSFLTQKGVFYYFYSQPDSNIYKYILMSIVTCLCYIYCFSFISITSFNNGKNSNKTNFVLESTND